MKEGMPRLSYIQSSLTCLKSHRLVLWEHKPGMVTHGSNVPVFLLGAAANYISMLSLS